MIHEKFRTVIRSAVGAVLLMPAIAIAQSDSSSPPRQGGTQGTSSGSQSSGSQGSGSQGSGSQGSGSQGTRGTAPQGGSSSASGTTSGGSQTGATGGSQGANKQPGMHSGSSSSASAARQSIDPAEVQRVLGTDVTVVDLQSLGAEQIRSLQQSLKDHGHYTGAVDGVYGPQTRAGLSAVLAQQYALNQRLISQGKVADPLASSMGIQQNDRTAVGGTDTRSGQQGSSMNRTQSTTRPGGSQTSGSSNSGSSGSSSAGSSGTSGSTNSGTPGGSSAGMPNGSGSGTHNGSGTP